MLQREFKHYVKANLTKHLVIFYFQLLHKAIFALLHVSAKYCSHHQGANITKTEAAYCSP
jgi:hypothetical protein